MIKSAKRALIAVVMVATTGPAMAATSTVDTAFYSNLLNYINSEFAFSGAEYQAFGALGLRGAELQNLSSAFSNLYKSQLTLVDYLQNKITVS